jgi:hypothetical protein
MFALGIVFGRSGDVMTKYAKTVIPDRTIVWMQIVLTLSQAALLLTCFVCSDNVFILRHILCPLHFALKPFW